MKIFRPDSRTPWSKIGYNSDIQSTEEIVSPQGGTAEQAVPALSEAGERIEQPTGRIKPE